jgi:hypothetical protein
MWRYNPETRGRIETPTDRLGLVDLDGLVTIARATVHPEFSWHSPFNDVHHLQWFASNYPSDIDLGGAVTMSDFRELVSRKAYIPRVFHNWIHHVTLPPPVPSIEVMRHCVEAERVAVGLYKTAGLAMRLTRMTHIPEKKLAERLEEEYINYTLYFENAREVPQEFSLLAIEELEVQNVEELLLINKRLGKLAIGTVPIRHRQILQAA